MGDRVLTHTGVYRKVRQVYKRNFSGEMYTIRPLGAPFPLRVTQDHPLLVSTRVVMKKGRLEKQVRKPSWKTPKDLKVGDYLTLPIIKETEMSQSTINSLRQDSPVQANACVDD